MTMKRGTEWSPFDDLALEYDAWFDREGSLIFSIEVRAFKSLLSTLPKPWLEIGVGSGRFAQALGIETGIDPSSKLLQMAGLIRIIFRMPIADVNYGQLIRVAAVGPAHHECDRSFRGILAH